MKPVKQTKFGKSGNCLWACVASMLEIDITDLPDTEYTDNDDEEAWYESFNKLQEYLKSKHKVFIVSIVNSEWIKQMIGESYVIGTGISKSSGLNHCVIVKNGVLVHDPKGAYDVEEIQEYDLFVKYYE